jgi:hypothetical protein
MDALTGRLVRMAWARARHNPVTRADPRAVRRLANAKPLTPNTKPRIATTTMTSISVNPLSGS